MQPSTSGSGQQQSQQNHQHHPLHHQPQHQQQSTSQHQQQHQLLHQQQQQPPPPQQQQQQPTVQPKVAPATLPEAQRYAQKRQLALLADDCKRVCNADITRPFANAQDAIDRLLPFHILGGLDGPEADLEDTPDHQGRSLVCSRQQVWADVMLRRNVDFACRYDSLSQQVLDLERRAGVMPCAHASGAAGPKSSEAAASQRTVPGCPAAERYLMSKLLLADARERLEQEKKRPGGQQQQQVHMEEEPEEAAPRAEQKTAAAAAAVVAAAVVAAGQRAHVKVEAAGATSEPVERLPGMWAGGPAAASIAVPLKFEAAAATVEPPAAAVKQEAALPHAAAAGPSHVVLMPCQEPVPPKAEEASHLDANSLPGSLGGGLGGFGGGMGDFSALEDDGLEEYIEED